jgi:hypothetical protein
MDRNDERAAGSTVPDGAIPARDPRLDALDHHVEERDRLFIWALYQEALGELERTRGSNGLSAGIWVAVDAEKYIFFVRFLVGLIVTVGVLVVVIRLGINVVVGAA